MAFRKVPQFLYVISLDGGAAVKVGASCRPERRVSQLAVAELSPKLFWRSDLAYDEALIIERAAHWALREHHLYDEWFAAPAAACVAAVTSVIAEAGAGVLIKRPRFMTTKLKAARDARASGETAISRASLLAGRVVSYRRAPK